MSETQQISAGEDEETVPEETVNSPDLVGDGQEAPEVATPPESTADKPSTTRWQKVHSAITSPIVLPWWSVYALAAVAPFVLVFGLWSRWGSDQWGNVASWFAGFATVAAVVVALRQAEISRQSARAAAVAAGAAKDEADARLEREIDAYRKRMEAQLQKSEELYERRVRAEALELQRSELMVLWTVLDEIHLAAGGLPMGDGFTVDVRRKWQKQRAKLMLAHSRAMLFLFDEEVLAAIGGVTDAVDRFNAHAKAVATREVTFSSAEDAESARIARLRAITDARIELRRKASVRLTEFMPDAEAQ